MMKRTLLILTMLLGLVCPLAAQMDDEEEMHGGRPEKGEESKARYKANLKKHKGNPDMLVLPGVLANKKEQYVDILCETTELAARSASEYIIVNEKSSHGYEAMLWTFAKPSDLHKGLEFIGVKAGAPMNFHALRFWSKGERIVASAIIKGEAIRIERLILDTEKDDTLPEKGFVFTGSIMIDNPTGGVEQVYLADAYDPRSIIAAYNEPASVLDPPWFAQKGEFYDSHVSSPEFEVGDHELVTVRFEPEFKDGTTRIRNFKLEVTEDREFLFRDAVTGKEMTGQPSLEAVLEVCKELIAKGKEPFATVRFDDMLPLEKIQPVCSILIMLDSPNGLRIEPPAKGRLFYRSFIPNRRWREPGNRMIQPWELHLEVTDGKVSGTLAYHDAEWKQGKSKPDLTKREYKVSTPAQIPERLHKHAKERQDAGRRPPPEVLLIYAPKTLQYGKLLKFIGPAIKTHSTVHLFLEAKEEPIEL